MSNTAEKWNKMRPENLTISTGQAIGHCGAKLGDLENALFKWNKKHWKSYLKVGGREITGDEEVDT